MNIPANPLDSINKEVHKNLFSKQSFNKLKQSHKMNGLYSKSSKALNNKQNQGMKLKKSKGPYKGNRIKYKTEICKLWANNEQCKFGDKCLFAHGEKEIQRKETETEEDCSHQSDDTQICNYFFKEGYCLEGSNCKRRHSNYTTYFSFANSLKKLSQSPVESIKQDSFILGKRLNVFHLLTQDNSNSEVLSTEECESDSNHALQNKVTLFNTNDDLYLIKSKEM